MRTIIWLLATATWASAAGFQALKPPAGATFKSVAVHGANIFAIDGVGNKVLKSADKGATWEPVPLPASQAEANATRFVRLGTSLYVDAKGFAANVSDPGPGSPVLPPIPAGSLVGGDLIWSYGFHTCQQCGAYYNIQSISRTETAWKSGSYGFVGWTFLGFASRGWDVVMLGSAVGQPTSGFSRDRGATWKGITGQPFARANEGWSSQGRIYFSTPQGLYEYIAHADLWRCIAFYGSNARYLASHEALLVLRKEDTAFFSRNGGHTFSRLDLPAPMEEIGEFSLSPELACLSVGLLTPDKTVYCAEIGALPIAVRRQGQKHGAEGVRGFGRNPQEFRVGGQSINLNGQARVQPALRR